MSERINGLEGAMDGLMEQAGVDRAEVERVVARIEAERRRQANGDDAADAGGEDAGGESPAA